MRHRRIFAPILAFLVAGGIAAGPAAAQKAKDTLRLAATLPIQTVSYYFDPKPDTVLESNAVYDGLVSYDPRHGRFEPLLAKSWTRIDPRTLEFTLRDDVTWHDGKPFTAADVAYTLNWLGDPATRLRFKQNWSWIAKAEALGPHRVRVTARRPTPFDLMRFGYVTTILPGHLLASADAKDKAAFGRHPVGTGPYRAVSVDTARGIVLERNPAYDRHANPAKPGTNIGRIVIRPVPEEGTRVAELLAGGLDVIQQVPYVQAVNLARDPRFELRVVPGNSFTYVAFDAKGRSGAKPVQDERVRRALAMAIDRPALVELLAGDTRMHQPEAMCWRTQAGCDYSLKPPPYDPAGARKLLAAAGYPDGFAIEITTFVGAASEVAEAVAGQWHSIGVRSRIDRRTVGSYRKKQRDGKIQVMVAAWPAGNIPDVSGTVNLFFVDGPGDYSGDATLHALAHEMESTMDPAKRKTAGRRMFDLATAKVYFLPLTAFPSILVHTAEVAIAPAERFTPLGYEISDIRWK
jgi:peptide/nickel transport system substrate-binding protein